MEKAQRASLIVLILTVILVFMPAIIPKSKFEGSGIAIEYTDTKRIPQDLCEIRDVEERKMRFLHILLPLVLKSNEKVISQRKAIQEIQKTSWWMTKGEKLRLDQIAAEYGIDADVPDEAMDALLERVNVLPVSLVLAQAAIESGWGTSRFALEGNNLFGLRRGKGEGMVPYRQKKGSVFRVSVFSDLQSCVDYYLWNINTYPAYKELREIRAASSLPYDSIVLAKGLEFYSEQGQVYVEKVRGMIRYNRLKTYDQYYLLNP
ncbi:MAG: glucosaminidase domain-containing protein [Thermodesulfobacteriota bacterium]|nr:glucosaminidase domain-containing protein [Thermodesulfobacteriota bacterium]